MILSEEVYNEIRADIMRCENHINIPGSEALFNLLKAKYTLIDADFGKNLLANGKCTSLGGQFDFREELKAIASKLKMLILINPLPDSGQGDYSGEGKAAVKTKIFLVHGHDNAVKNEVARTLEKAGFEAVILHEQASAGKTIIEKIESYTDVSFAVILYTPCDIGRDKETDETGMRNRARQNVVFEHGYLISRLSRKNVSALVKGDVETPSDISGVVYIEMDDADAWKAKLAKEMRESGIPVDLNRFYF